MANRLITEKSPYLLQHAHNPVDWYPWGDEAFAVAEREDKPIFLSIGYSTCHWCHVMERESFEDPATAALMNNAFINIKVDREERPDIDAVYMAVCQLVSGHGGWPLTVVMTPAKKPFFAATYIPRQSTAQRAGMLQLIPRIVELWHGSREELLQSAEGITAGLLQKEEHTGGGTVTEATADGAYNYFYDRFDREYAGFGGAPKFPSPHNLIFLLRHGVLRQEPDAVAMAEQTLRAIRLGGMYDHAGGGAHRYSTDRKWILPHFEKMLYDQAMLLYAYSEAWAQTREPLFEQAADELFTYVTRDLCSPGGAFYCAEDADSEGEEGKFYTWTAAELREAAGDAYGEFATAFGIEDNGNFYDPFHGGYTGANVLYQPFSLREDTAPEVPAYGSSSQAVLQELYRRRGARVRPHRDDKVLTDWNGLMIAALAKAAAVFADPRYLAAAEKAMNCVWVTMARPNGRLMHRWRGGEAGINGFLDDYAFMAHACLELYNATFNPGYLQQAAALQDYVQQHFQAPGGLYYFTADDSEQLLTRSTELYDGAIPSGNSMALYNLARLARLTGSTEYSARAEALLAGAADAVDAMPSAYSWLLCGAQLLHSGGTETVLCGTEGSSGLTALLEAVREEYNPGMALLVKFTDERGKALAAIAPFTAGMDTQGGTAAAYVCRDFACGLPVTGADALRKELAR